MSALSLTEEHLEFFQALGITNYFVEWFWNYCRLQGTSLGLDLPVYH